MAKPVSIPNSFATSTSAIPLSYLDQDFNALANATNDLATYSNYVADTGSANAYIANFPANTNTSSLTAGLGVQFKAANANTGTSTLNVQVNSVSIGSATIKLTDGSNLPANAIVAGAMVSVMYDGTNFQLLSDSSGGSEVITNLTVTGNATVAGTTTLTGNLTVDTNTLFVDTANNNVGIGTSSPITRLNPSLQALNTSSLTTTNIRQLGLTISGTSNSNVTGDIISGLAMGTAAEEYAAIYAVDGGSSGATAMAFATGNSSAVAERMRIDSSGNVLVGQTSTSGGADGKLSVTTATGSGLPAFTAKSSDGAGQYTGIFYNAATTGNNSFLLFGTEGTFTTRGGITYNRGAGLTAYNTTSDQRLKENIVDASSALSKIDSIKIRSFDWKESGNHVDFGVIAQELISVAPECVTEGDDGDEIKSTWQVDTSALVPALVKAIQELNAKVTSLEAQLKGN